MNANTDIITTNTVEEMLDAYTQGARNFKGLNAAGADLRHRDLAYASFFDCTFDNADFSFNGRARMTDCRFYKCSFKGANFQRADLFGLHFGDSDLAGANFFGARLCGGTRIKDSNLRGARFVSASMQEACIMGGDLTDTSFKGAVATYMILASTDACPLNLQGSDIFELLTERKMPAQELRLKVADLIEQQPELHDQTSWGTDGRCNTPCCVAGWACRLGGHPPRLMSVALQATLLLLVDGKPLPSFDGSANREDILKALRA